MSRPLPDLQTDRGLLQVLQFAGPNGPMLQLTQGFGGRDAQGIDQPGFVQFSPEDLAQLIPVLTAWVKEISPL